jgi:hypothetical protein
MEMGAEGEAGRRHEGERPGLDAGELCGRRNRRQKRHDHGAAAHYEARQRRSLEEEQADEGHVQSPVGCRTVYPLDERITSVQRLPVRLRALVSKRSPATTM